MLRNALIAFAEREDRENEREGEAGAGLDWDRKAISPTVEVIVTACVYVQRHKLLFIFNSN